MEVQPIYSSVKNSLTYICVSEVNFNFNNFQQESKLVSQKISVPEMGQYGKNSNFNNVNTSEFIKFYRQVTVWRS